MWANIEQLLQLSQQNSERIKSDMKMFDAVFDNVQNTVPDDQKGELQRVRAQMNKAINLAKEGKTNEANDVINNLKNGR